MVSMHPSSYRCTWEIMLRTQEVAVGNHCDAYTFLMLSNLHVSTPQLMHTNHESIIMKKKYYCFSFKLLCMFT